MTRSLVRLAAVVAAIVGGATVVAAAASIDVTSAPLLVWELPYDGPRATPGDPCALDLESCRPGASDPAPPGPRP